jgi:hypothetical protein
MAVAKTTGLSLAAGLQSLCSTLAEDAGQPVTERWCFQAQKKDKQSRDELRGQVLLGYGVTRRQDVVSIKEKVSLSSLKLQSPDPKKCLWGEMDY